jgi:hypothetical protein
LSYIKYGSLFEKKTRYKKTINKKPSRSQNIENVRLQYLCIAVVYLLYLYFLKKKTKPDNNKYTKKPTDKVVNKNLFTGISLKIKSIVSSIKLNIPGIIQF